MEDQTKQDLSEDEQYNKDLRVAVIELLNKFESEKNLKVIFAAETGSRGQGFHTKDSDCDIKGFFSYSEDQYLSITDYPLSFLSEEYEINVQGKDIDVDFSFTEFRYYGEQRLNKENEKLNIIFTSSVQYVNLFEQEMFNKFVYHTIKAPKKAFYSDLETFITRRIRKEDVECRKILNTLQCLMTLVHFTSSDKLYQYSYNLWQEIEINPYLDGRTKKNIQSFAKECFEKKNFSRKATIKRKSLPIWFTQMLDLYNSQRDESLVIEETTDFKEQVQQLHLYAMKLK